MCPLGKKGSLGKEAVAGYKTSDRRNGKEDGGRKKVGGLKGTTRIQLI